MRRSTFPGLFVSDGGGEEGEGAQWPGGDPVFRLLVHSSRDLLPPTSTQFAGSRPNCWFPTTYPPFPRLLPPSPPPTSLLHSHRRCRRCRRRSYRRPDSFDSAMLLASTIFPTPLRSLTRRRTPKALLMSRRIRAEALKLYIRKSICIILNY